MAEKKKILIVEDDPNFGSILKDYLRLHSYDVTLAKNGIEGLEKFKKISYDLCILDVMMPFKDGFSLATDIRSANEEIPLIFLTAKSLKEDVIKGFKIGADDYLIKPFDSEILLLKIKSLFKRKYHLIKIILMSLNMNLHHINTTQNSESFVIKTINLLNCHLKRASCYHYS